MAQKPSIPKGTRDFSPAEMAGRNWIFDTIRSVYRSYGYSEIETPSLENLSTLLGKYGDEGDKLLFKVLNSGDAFSGIDFPAYALGDGAYNSNALSLKVSEKGLRYDLTVPFARYVVQHRDEITFPFKRFQIQPVWRADRPQKGRYREFYQCDADVIGSPSLVNEMELVQIIDKVFTRFGLNVSIRINNRKILTGLAEVCGFPDKVVDITVAIDKIDKIGLDKVKEEMLARGLDEKALAVIEPVLLLSGSNAEKMASIKDILGGGSPSGIVSETGLKGVEEIVELFGLIEGAGISNEVVLDLSLARGLNYYTGAIFEVKSLDYQIGSISGGGRYDDLTGIFGLPGVSGVGISFGADRIYDVLKALDKFPEGLKESSRLLFANMGSVPYIVPVAEALRAKGVPVEIYPDQVKLKKQFDYADRKGIRFLSINGTEEEASGKVNIKNLERGEQKLFPADDIAAILEFIA